MKKKQNNRIIGSTRTLPLIAVYSGFFLVLAFVFYLSSVASTTFLLVETNDFKHEVRGVRSDIALLEGDLNISLDNISISDALGMGYKKTTVKHVVNADTVVVLNQ